MTANLEAFQHLLRGMRERFLDELPERCDELDNLVLVLERTPDDRETFNELFRRVHSLKGSGGTHGLPVITAICHQFENFITEAGGKAFGEDFANRAFAHVDLLRRVESPARLDSPDFAAIESAIESLRQSALQSRKAGLVAESSAMMARIYEAALASLPVRLTVVDNGLAALERLAHETYAFAIVGRELKELNGVAVVAALRASQGANQDIPVVMVSSNRDGIPAHCRLQAVLGRDRQLGDNLAAALQPIISK